MKISNKQIRIADSKQEFLTSKEENTKQVNLNFK